MTGLITLGVGEIKVIGHHLADAVYHSLCYTNFRTGYYIRIKSVGYWRCRGLQAKAMKAISHEQERVFTVLCHYLEGEYNQVEQTTLLKLQHKIDEFLTNKESVPWSTKHLKRKLTETYGESVLFIASDCGRPDIVNFNRAMFTLLW